MLTATSSVSALKAPLIAVMSVDDAAAWALICRGPALPFANAPSGATLQTADGRARFTVLYAGQNTLRLTDLQINNDPGPLTIAITPQPTALRITWNAIPGTTYRVQSANNLTDGFSDLSPPITASPTDTTLQFDTPFPAETRFFRLHIP